MNTPSDLGRSEGITELLKEACERHAAGDLGAAERCYRAVLAQRPDHAGAIGGLGALLGQSGRPEHAVAYLSKACALEPGNVVLQHNYGEALRQSGNLALAEATLRRALALDSRFLPAYASLLPLLRVAHAQALARRDPGRAAQVAHDLATFASNHGNALLEIHDTVSAIACYRTAIEYRPDYAAAWSNLGNVLRNEGKVSEAEDACRRAIDLDARLAPAWNNLGNALAEQMRFGEALACYEQALAASPDMVEAKHNRGSGMLFNQLYLPNLDGAQIAEQHRAWGAQFPAPSKRFGRTARDPRKRLRIGYLSPDFRQHAMRHFLEPLLARHDADAVEVVCYAANPVADAHTQRLIAYGHRWVWAHRLTDDELGSTIESDAIDILVDCAGHTHGTRLAALAGKPAPIMMSWLGYLCTTGLPAMDYRLTDAWVDPPGATEKLHTEALLRVPGGMLAYRPHEDAPAAARSEREPQDRITFGSLNNVQKINARVVSLWADILRQVPESKLLLQGKLLTDPMVCGRIRGLFEAFGVDAHRLDLRPASPDFLMTYREIDIALDTWPYGGGATTCDALWMGVPVVTWSGNRPAGRLSTSILHQVGRVEWIAESGDDYVRKVAALARQVETLRANRAGLREQMRQSSLCDEAGFVRRLEAVYREAWGRWIASA